jgi:hypothetical protein
MKVPKKCIETNILPIATLFSLGVSRSSYASMRQRRDLGDTSKYAFTSMSSSHIPSLMDTLASGNCLKKSVVARSNSIQARCMPIQAILEC